MPSKLYTLVLNDVWGHLLVGSRLLGLMLYFPGLSSNTVTYKMRFLIIMCLSFVLTPLIFNPSPSSPPGSWAVCFSIFQEVFMGIIFSFMLKTLFSALDVAGSIMGLQMNLSNIFVHNSDTNQQEGFLSGYINLISVTLVFITHYHYRIFDVFIKTFHYFTPTHMEDIYSIFIETLTSSFVFGVTMAGPFIVISVLTYILAGVLNRLIPQMQVFFLIQPLQLIMGFSILIISLSIILDFFQDKLNLFLENLGAPP